jgi:hypothetical protein
VSSRTDSRKAVGMTWHRAHGARSRERSARLLQAAERDAEAAAARYRAMKEAAAAPISAHRDGSGSRRPMPSWQQLLLLVVGGGLLTGLLMMWLLTTAYVGPAALLVLPVAGGMAAGVVVLRRRQPEPVVRRRRPLVADLVRAAREMHEAESALQRLRDEHDGGTGRGLDTMR